MQLAACRLQLVADCEPQAAGAWVLQLSWRAADSWQIKQDRQENDTCNCPNRRSPSVYHYSMANFVYVLVKGMDMTPGGPDESAVPPDQRLGSAVDLEQRVQLLVRGAGGGAARN